MKEEERMIATMTSDAQVLPTLQVLPIRQELPMLQAYCTHPRQSYAEGLKAQSR